LAVEDLYRALWRHKILILLLTAIAVAATWYVTSRETPVYQSSALLRVQQKVTDPTQSLGVLTAGGLLAKTYTNIVTTTSIADRISKQLGGRIPPSQIHLTASAVSDLDLLWVNARSRDPRIAQRVAAAAPVALVSFIRETGTLRDEVITVQKPELPTSAVSHHRTFNIAIALLLALIFNGALALLIELFSDRVADLDELERITQLPVLATVPKLAFSDQPTMKVSPRAGNADVLPGEMLRPRRTSRPVREARGG
jgi:capsular polysaccharide biosynthesis protein